MPSHQPLGRLNTWPDPVRQNDPVTSLAVQTDTPELRKARGAFFTPDAIAQYVADWAIRDLQDRVLEPSCGEAAFLLAAARRITRLGGDPSEATLDGVELHKESAASASEWLRSVGVRPSITVSDFFDVEATASYDAVIGNPPYVRYQDHAGSDRLKSRAAALRGGVSMSGLASSWAAFTVHSALFLKPGGRMGLVIPAELLSVNYASEVRRFLLEKFASVELVLFTERVFPEVQEEVVLLLADGYEQSSASHITVSQVRNGRDLGTGGVGRVWQPMDPSAKWTPSMLSAAALDTYAKVQATEGFTTLGAWADTTLGIVTGNNSYFALTQAKVNELELLRSDLKRLSPPGSKHLRGLAFTDYAWAELAKAESKVWLFRPGANPSPAALAYIAAGEAAGVHKTYKCRVRKPWWQVPLQPAADLVLTYMNADTPRLTTNTAGTLHLNSVHGVYPKSDHASLARELLPVAALTSMTLVGAETVGRAYGGGMLKIEPREADHLPLPSHALVESVADRLRLIRPHVGQNLRSGKLLEAAKLVDDVILLGALGLPRSEVKALREAHADLTSRRKARGGRGTD